MLIRRLVISLVLLIFTVTCFAPPVWASPQVQGKSAVLIDSKSGQILFAKNENMQLAPASTTKIMTAGIALEKCKLTDIVTAGKNAANVEPSAIGLKEGETMTMENLLYSLLLKSANDAAVDIAEHISGSVEGFAALMNAKAKDWGATNTHFVNPNGLPDPNHYTTTHDLALIARHAMENPVFRKIVATKVKTIPRADDKAIKWLQNHNKMLWRYKGANGIKTGYTVEAKQCLAASAERNGQEFIAVVLGAEGNNVWTDAQNLLNYGFDNFVTARQKAGNTRVMAVPVKKGENNVELVTEKDFYYTQPKGAKNTVAEKVEVNKNIEAPVQKGQVLGKIIFSVEGKQIGFVNLVAQNNVAAKRPILQDKSVTGNSLIVAAFLLGLFIAWRLRKISKKRRRRRRYWINRNIIR